MMNIDVSLIKDRKEVSNFIKNIHPTHNKKGRHKYDKTVYRNCICAFDIETTRIKEIEQSIMYIWQFAVMDMDTQEIQSCYGRTWDEFRSFIHDINDNFYTLLIFVHNLSYEFQFLRHMIEIKKDKVFSLKPRKILRCESGNLRFQCSYLQTNKSLDKFTTDMNVKHKKLSGVKFDYSKIRYPWTKLDLYEIGYSMYDVIGLLEAMYIRITSENDSLYSLPLTSTGYVRRKAKQAMKKYNYKQLHNMMCDEKIYTMLRNEFRGGDTHANRYHVNKILKNVASYDRASSYPDVMLNYQFPMSPFIPRLIDDINDLETLCEKRNYCFLAEFTIENLQQKDIYYGAPYLSKDKAMEIVNPIIDNGRVLSCDKCVYVFNDIDWKIIKTEYTGQVKIKNVYTAKYNFLPNSLRELVVTLFHDKTKLKNVKGKELDYMKSKELINALYGMCAQNPVKPEILYIDEIEKSFDVEKDIDIKEKLEKYNKKAFLLYAWGCWVTSWARLKLKEMINIVGDNFVYCDTDSVKFIVSNDYGDIVKKIDKYNRGLTELSISNNGYATDTKGKTHYLGVYEYEETYKRFKTLGAKKYVYEDEKTGNLHITIAGVPKKKGAEELEKIENFKTGFVFSHTGKLESVYNDIDYGLYNPDGQTGHDLYISSNVVLRESTYQIGLSAEYMRILASVGNWHDFIDSIKMKGIIE